jgi:hypothetical protein
VLSGFYWALQDITMASEDPNISQQGNAGKRKYITLIISQKLKITGRTESGKCQSVVMTSHNIGSLTRHDITKQEDHCDYLWHQV